MFQPNYLGLCEKLKFWKFKPNVPTELSQNLGLDSFSAQLLFNRKIETLKQVEIFLNPNHDSLINPYDLPEMELAVERIKTALENNESIGIFGDFDVDGISATAILLSTLNDFGISAFPYIPNRVSEGHGLNRKSLDYFKSKNVSLIITVDCGTTDLDEVSNAKSMGIDVIITDHHLPLESRPNSAALINPNLPESNYSNKNLTGSGTAFKLATAIYNSFKKPIPNTLIQYAALGTISDVGILNPENRFIVSEGITQMRNTQSIGLKALAEKSGTNLNTITSQDAAFKLIPRLNAPGRLENAIIALEILTTTNENTAHKVAIELESLNEKRKSMTSKSIFQARNQTKSNQLGIDIQEIIIVQHNDWHPGIIGLIANQLSEQFSKPAIAIATNGKNSKGSARSVVDFNIIEALKECSDILTKFGGHSKAAGFTIDETFIPELIKRLANTSNQKHSSESKSKFEIECTTTVKEVINHFEFILSLEPFGPGNPTPIFLSQRMKVINAKTVGHTKDHLKMTLSDNEKYYDSIGFGLGNLIGQSNGYIDIIYQISENTWNGMTNFQLIIKDFVKSE
ncbi:MAG: single-stranded-DNA-specific exonuclease RecJ [Chloroflexi bacterium]|nr:single-stranded-DNA-specific exonuclease RecJ [Chloroflexota bacterium]